MPSGGTPSTSRWSPGLGGYSVFGPRAKDPRASGPEPEVDPSSYIVPDLRIPSKGNQIRLGLRTVPLRSW
ncbi:hypothetical protein GUJ93_ZPchr0016g2551 [Zizania palustris]|uniref:Uncharacterized protein n=1 Tax=Zizania palustris TaxID=103762 RepID=A0A8J5W684_ZIZPA|nr:hypothetical protein GUJ93_ZPchr0016g2551 [Zizania palustris]